MADAPLFNPKRPRLLRQTVSTTENWVTVAIGFALIALVLWVFAQRNNYDPGARDVSVDMLQAASTNAKLYTPALKSLPAPTTPNPQANAAGAQAQVGVFPIGIFAGGWQLASKPKQFDADNLFEKINGEAPRFLKQGFQQLHYIKIKDADNRHEIAIELFDQGNVAGSSGVFAEHKKPDTATENHQQSIYFRTAIGAIGRAGNYFYRITGDAESTAVTDHSVRVAQAFSALAPGEATAPAPAADLVGADGDVVMTLLRDALSISEAQLSFQAENVFQYDFAHGFWFGEISIGDSAKGFAHLGQSADEVAQMARMLVEELRYDFDDVALDSYPDAGTGLSEMHLFKHQYLGTYMTIGRDDRMLFGVENSDTVDDAIAVTRTIANTWSAASR